MKKRCGTRELKPRLPEKLDAAAVAEHCAAAGKPGASTLVPASQQRSGLAFLPCQSHKHVCICYIYIYMSADVYIHTCMHICIYMYNIYMYT